MVHQPADVSPIRVAHHTQAQIWVAGPSSLHQAAGHVQAMAPNDICSIDLSKKSDSSNNLSVAADSFCPDQHRMDSLHLLDAVKAPDCMT